MRNQYLTIILVIVGVFVMSSYRSISNKHVDSPYRAVYSIPIKQSYFIVTEDQRRALRLIKKGWELQDVDFLYVNGVHEYYTLIKYAN